MSAKLSPEDVLFQQRFLRQAGLYLAKLDGIYGPKTDAAWKKFDIQTTIQRGRYGSVGAVSAVSERNVGTMLPYAQGMARTIVKLAKANGIDARITSGTRTYDEQALLYAKGRTTPGPRVTNAKPGSSWHNFGSACDVSIFVGGAYQNSHKPYKELAAIVIADKAFMEDWGGNWASIVDVPHYQLTGGRTISQVRKMWEAGTPFLPVP